MKPSKIAQETLMHEVRRYTPSENWILIEKMLSALMSLVRSEAQLEAAVAETGNTKEEQNKMLAEIHNRMLDKHGIKREL